MSRAGWAICLVGRLGSHSIQCLVAPCPVSLAENMNYIDLHCHWVAGIDDGARNVQESLDMLRALHDVGFGHVVATPHMRTGLFDNQRGEIVDAYRRCVEEVGHQAGVPQLSLASEHHLDDLVFSQLIAGAGLPYPPAKAAVLIEFPNDRFPLHADQRMFELRCKRMRPVLAHPERYRPVQTDHHCLDGLLDGGTLLLLDVAALAGKYGRSAKKAALRMLEDGYYYAACSDSHHFSDAKVVQKGIARLEAVMGSEEADFLLRQGPQHILDGTVED